MNDITDPDYRFEQHAKARLSTRVDELEIERAKLRALSVEAMIYCYDEANRLANHGHGGHDRMAMENLYAIANKARKELGLENVERKDWK